jgi:hypothetical protein
VAREEDPGLLGVDHPLDHDGHINRLRAEPLLVPVVDRPLGEQGGPTLLDAVQQVVAVDVEERFLLSGERRIREVLGGGGGPDGHERIVAELIVCR